MSSELDCIRRMGQRKAKGMFGTEASLSQSYIDGSLCEPRVHGYAGVVWSRSISLCILRERSVNHEMLCISVKASLKNGTVTAGSQSMVRQRPSRERALAGMRVIHRVNIINMVSGTLQLAVHMVKSWIPYSQDKKRTMMCKSCI